MKDKISHERFRSMLRLTVVICERIVLLGVMLVCITAGSAVAALIDVHEIIIDGTPVNSTPNPQPTLVGNGTGANPLLPNIASADSIIAPTGGLYTTPDGVFTVAGSVRAVNIGGQFASLMLTVTAIDNNPVLDGQLGGDTVDLVFRQDYAMTISGVGVAAEILDGVCNQSAQDAGSTVETGVNVNSTVVLPSLTGTCAPLGQFLNSATTQVSITPSMFFQGDLVFNFREGAAGQAISLPDQAQSSLTL